MPNADLLLAFEVTFKTDILDRPIGSQQIPATLQMGRHTFDCEAWKEVVFIGEVTDCPKQMRSGSFGLRLDTHFHCPLRVVLVTNTKFGTGALIVLIDEPHCSVRLVLLSARAVIEIPRSDLAGVTPEEGIDRFLGSGMSNRYNQ